MAFIRVRFATLLLANTLATAPDLRLSQLRWGMAAQAVSANRHLALLLVAGYRNRLSDGMGSIGKARVLPSFYSIGRMRDEMPRDQRWASPNSAQLTGLRLLTYPPNLKAVCRAVWRGERRRCAVRMTAKGSATPWMACGSRPVKRLPQRGAFPAVGIRQGQGLPRGWPFPPWPAAVRRR
jgi:hypothetical protein